jgi:hypothetical protein
MESIFDIQQKLEDEKNMYQIEQAHKLTLDMKAESEKYLKLAALAEQDEILTLKKALKCRYLRLLYPVKGANAWLRKLERNEKIDHRKKYEEKDKFDYLTNQINELFDVDATIENFSFYGYEESAVDIYFTIKESFPKKYELMIPDTEKLNISNLNYCAYGRLRLSYESSPHCYYPICESYSFEELKNKFKEWRTPTPM